MTAYCYVRVSTKEQAVDGLSLITQTEECLRFVTDHNLVRGTESNYDNPGVFADPGVSAWKTDIFKRPGFMALWKAVKPGDTIVFLSLDRGFRSVMNFSTTWDRFQRAGINAVFIRDRIDMSTATGRLMAHLCATFAQFKSDMISQRLKEGNARKRARLELKKIEGDSPGATPLESDTSSLDSSGDVIKIHSPSRAASPSRQAPNSALAGLCAADDMKFPDGIPSIPEGARALGYARVSSDAQSMENQVSGITSKMQRLVNEGYECGDLFEDHGISAFTTDWHARPAGKELFEEAREGDLIVISRPDRAFRSIRDMASRCDDMIQHGIHLVTCCGLDTRTEMGRQAVEILAMMAAWESRDMSWRKRLSVRYHNRMNGRWHSPLTEQQPKYLKKVQFEHGWTLHPRFEVEDEIRRIWDLHEQGLTLEEISDAMEEWIADRDNRMPMPRLPVNPKKYYTGLIGRRKVKANAEKWSKEQLENLRQYMMTLPKSKDGEIFRRWNRNIVYRVCRTRREEIEAIMEMGVVEGTRKIQLETIAG